MENLTISKAKPAHKSMDYDLLRREGIKHIEKLAGSLWTDYNSHDPGITVLEVLCFAITDLGYRTNLPVEDLLAGSPDQDGKDFFPIREILPCNPITLKDLRKLIIGFEGIRNAWIEKVDKNESPVRGLYDITLELEEHLELNNLNYILIRSHIKAGYNNAEYEFDTAFSSLSDFLSVESIEEITHITFHKNSSDKEMFIRIKEYEYSEEHYNDYYVELVFNNNPELLTALDIKFTGDFAFGDEKLQHELMEELLLKEMTDQLLEAIQEELEDDQLTENLLRELLESLLEALKNEVNLPERKMLMNLLDELRGEERSEELTEELQEEGLQQTLSDKIREMLEETLQQKKLLEDLMAKLLAELQDEAQDELLEEYLKELHKELLLEDLIWGLEKDDELLQKAIEKRLLEELLTQMVEDNLPEKGTLERLLPKIQQEDLQEELWQEVQGELQEENLKQRLLDRLKEKTAEELQQEIFLEKLLEQLQQGGDQPEQMPEDSLKKLQDELLRALHKELLLENLIREPGEDEEKEQLQKTEKKLLQVLLEQLQEDLPDNELVDKLPEELQKDGDLPEELPEALQEGDLQQQLLNNLIKKLWETPLDRLLQKLLRAIDDGDLKEKPLLDELWKVFRKKKRDKKHKRLKKLITDVLFSKAKEGLISKYWKTVREIHSIVEPATRMLHNHRPLCEDFNSIKTLQVQEISLRADIDIAIDADVEEVLADIYYNVHNFLLPEPRFHTLEALKAKGKGIEEIFEGPLLENGFLDDEDMGTQVQRENIYTSDIHHILTNIPGLVAVRDLKITNYLNNDVISKDAVDCLKLYESKKYRPLLNADRTEINFYKDQLQLTVNKDTALKKFKTLKEKAKKKKTIASLIPGPPLGKDREVADYTSIQHHFPPVYGLGSEQLPDTISDTRKAQILQLKAYLLFFEQLLADYFSQLNNLRSLFSMESGIKNTYFSKLLNKTVPGAGMLLSKSYDQELPDIAEPPAEDGQQPGVFHKRRNRFLDHLMARFCESFSDYALYVYAAAKDKKTAAENLIADKTAFLKAYPALSHDRARAFNYLAEKEKKDETKVPDVWDTGNVPGLKKNIALRLGLKSYERKNMFDFLTIEEVSSQFKFKLNYNGHLLESPDDKLFDDKKRALDEALKVSKQALDRNNYETKGISEDFYFDLLNEDGESFALKLLIFDSEEERDNCMNRIISFKPKPVGFHVLEHLLLRPRAVAEPETETETETEPETEAITEPETGTTTETAGVDLSLPDAEELLLPYSFRISVIMPEGDPKLAGPNFMRYTEKVIRSETPAHIVPHIYWVNYEQACTFELYYKDWLEKRADSKKTLPEEIETARLNLIKELNKIIGVSGVDSV